MLAMPSPACKQKVFFTNEVLSYGLVFVTWSCAHHVVQRVPKGRVYRPHLCEALLSGASVLSKAPVEMLDPTQTENMM